MHNKLFLTVSWALLVVNGLSACIGGISFILDPSGKHLGMSIHSLEFLPIKNYLIPGIVLLAVNGISSLVIAALILKQTNQASFLLLIQGVVSALCILVTASVIPNNFYRLVYGTNGLALIMLGLLLFRSKQLAQF